jgi:integrase
MLRTKSGLPRHCCWNTDQHGKRRVRFRLRGFSTYLTGTPWSDDFMRQYAAALEGVKAQRAEVGAGRTKPGSFDALSVSYYRSPEFRGLKASTQAVRRNIIERFRIRHGDKPLKGLGRRHIKEIIGAMADTPEAANNLLKVLRVMLEYAVDQGMIASNPATGVKRYRSRGEGTEPWTEAAVAQYRTRHPINTRGGIALELFVQTMQRRGDVIHMGWQHMTLDEEGLPAIRVRQEKTDTPLLLPIHPRLETALAALPRTNLTFLMTERGAPFTAAGFGNWFRKQCDLAGLPNLSAHGLRKFALTRAANLGATHEQLKAFGGHRSDSALAPYLRTANQQRLARQLLNLMLGAEGEQKLSNHETRLDKRTAK